MIPGEKFDKPDPAIGILRARRHFDRGRSDKHVSIRRGHNLDTGRHVRLFIVVMNQGRGRTRRTGLVGIRKFPGWNECQFDGFGSLDQPVVDGKDTDLRALGAGRNHDATGESIIINAVFCRTANPVEDHQRRGCASGSPDGKNRRITHLQHSQPGRNLGNLRRIWIAGDDSDDGRRGHFKDVNRDGIGHCTCAATVSCLGRQGVITRQHV